MFCKRLAQKISVESWSLSNKLTKLRPDSSHLPSATTQFFSSVSHSTRDDPPEDLGLVERPRRSLFSVPGCDQRKINKATTLVSDTVVLDLEDGVPTSRKQEARDLVVQTLQDRSDEFENSELCVRINSLQTGEVAISDLDATLPCPSLKAIVLPKVESPQDIQFIRTKIQQLVPKPQSQDIRIIAAIESAKGMVNLHDIVKEATTHNDNSTVAKLDALVFASEDYCADLELIRTADATELLFARSQIVTMAKAYGLQAIDMVHIDFRNLGALAIECRQGKELGFTGKQVIHPAQIPTVNETFRPSPKDVEFATKCVLEYERATEAEGFGACEVDGIVVDAPVYKWALKILQRSKQAERTTS